MAKAKNWIFTDLSEDDVLELTIGGTKYKLASFAVSFTINVMPEARAVLAIGRDARDVNKTAAINKTATTLNSMLPALVKFNPSGEYDAQGEVWPESAQDVFDGFFTGFGHEKINGKIRVVAHLIHWTVELGMSSSLSSLMHTANPGSLLYPAVLTPATGVDAEPIFVPEYIGHDILTNTNPIAEDLWGGIKTFLCALAEFELPNFQINPAEFGLGDFKANDRAKNALKRIEGPGGDCSLDYALSNALPLNIGGQDLVQRAAATAIAHAQMDNFFAQTFWDVMISTYNTMFGLVFVPLVSKALIIADTPGFRSDGTGTFWQTVGPDEYVGIPRSVSMIPKPLRAIGIYSTLDSDTGVFHESEPVPGVAGGFVASGNNADDGAILVIGAPPWLKNVPSGGFYGGATTGNKEDIPVPSAMSPGGGKKPTDPPLSELRAPIAELYNRFAHSVYVNNTLRGRATDIVGRLRFDISPGSQIELFGSPELFLQGVDDLAATLFATVQTVTIAISAENRRATTSFRLTHVRNEKENGEDRTSIAEHPLFGKDAQVLGAPLVDAYKFDAGK